jgi:hypothetical protein
MPTTKVFCDKGRNEPTLRPSLMAFYVPGDIILRVILGRRKNPTA